MAGVSASCWATTLPMTVPSSKLDHLRGRHRRLGRSWRPRHQGRGTRPLARHQHLHRCHDDRGPTARLPLTGTGSIATSSGVNLAAPAPPSTSRAPPARRSRTSPASPDRRLRLAATALTVGTANSTTFAGMITDGGGRRGGALIKIGTGTLTLTGTNTYSGGTTVTRRPDQLRIARQPRHRHHHAERRRPAMGGRHHAPTSPRGWRRWAPAAAPSTPTATTSPWRRDRRHRRPDQGRAGHADLRGANTYAGGTTVTRRPDQLHRGQQFRHAARSR